MSSIGSYVPSFLVLLVLSSSVVGQEGDPIPGARRRRIEVVSSLDGTRQPSYVILPPGLLSASKPVPLLVALHSWSFGVEQRYSELERAALGRGWIYLFPDFRGVNDHPDACGSQKAQQDILDVVQWARETYNVDEERVYLTGFSGGGQMTMLMVGRYPEVWSAASAWVGISDLGSWYRLHARTKYGGMARRICGGALGDSPQVDEQYQRRSPVSFLHHAVEVPLDIAVGIHDGHRGPVPVRHSLDAFNVVAKAQGGELISDRHIAQLNRRNADLRGALPSDLVVDRAYGRKIHLRRQCGKARVTAFEGDHEILGGGAVDWLSRQRRKSLSPKGRVGRKALVKE